MNLTVLQIIIIQWNDHHNFACGSKTDLSAPYKNVEF